MAYINRLSDINNKLDINIENQDIANNKLNNIDDNIETIRNLNNTSNTKLDTLHRDLDGLTFDDSNNLQVIDNRIPTGLTVNNNALDVNQKVIQQGSYNNLINNTTFNSNSYSSSLNINGFSSNSLISYSDTQNLTDTILIFGSLNNSDYFHIGSLLPVYNSTLGNRYASSNINLAPIKYIKIYNTSSTNITNANCSILSG